MKGDALDHKALIREAYKIDGITAADCRAIFFDWALSLPDEANTQDTLHLLYERHAVGHEDHPMSVVLHEGMQNISVTGQRSGTRRGGRKARVAN